MSEETLWEVVDKGHFNVFIRDLSQSTNTNLKHMIEDMDISQDIETKIQTKKSKKHVSKKDIIIQKNTERLYQKSVSEDNRILEFLFENLDKDDPYPGFQKLNTTEAKQSYKFQLLSYYWKKKSYRKKYLHHIINLYFNLMNHGGETEKPLLDEIRDVLKQYDIKSYMMEKMGHLLPPLNFWDQTRTLDEWQKNVIHKIKNKESVLVRAPTSAGKTFVAMATGILHSKILYVCPAKPVVYQVGSAFVKMGYKVHYLVENHSHLSYDKATNIFIGIPITIEECLPKIGSHFNYAVFDEIHTLNDSLPYENIIKILRCPFLALSATIQNIRYLESIFQTYHPNTTIHFVEYTKRFINQQRWAYDSHKNSLKKVHPITCLDMDDPTSLDTIAMTPNDCVKLYERLENEFENIDDEEIDTLLESLNPDTYFSGDVLLSLDETKEYEIYLKRSLSQVIQKYPLVVEKIRDTSLREIAMKDTLEDIIPFMKQCQKKDMFPMLYFHTDEGTVKEIFLNVYESLQKQEEQNYPYHYAILEKKEELYQTYLKKRDIFESGIKVKGSKDAQTDKQTKLGRYDRGQKNQYIETILAYYDWCISQCSKNDDSYHDVSLDVLLEIRGKQIGHLQADKLTFQKNPDFRSQDVFQKHPDYCFTRGEPMSGSEIRSIKREIKRTIGQTIEYENPLFQLLKRGIGIYLESFPDEYNRVVQKLLSQRKLGIVISDRTLCLGIDLPIRSVAFSGYKDPMYSTSDYLQMSGRAGRRGHDNQGNTIFHNVNNYKSLMRGELPSLIGSSDKLYDSYNVISSLNPSINLHHMWSHRINGGFRPINKKGIVYEDTRFMKLVWLLRYHEASETFVNSLLKIEKKMFMEQDRDREMYLLKHIVSTILGDETLIMVYKKNKIEDNMKETLEKVKDIGDICKHMVNTLNTVTYKITITHCQSLFTKSKTLVYKYRLI